MFSVGDKVKHSASERVYEVSKVLHNGDFFVKGFEAVGPEHSENFLLVSAGSNLDDLRKVVSSLREQGMTVEVSVTETVTTTL